MKDWTRNRFRTARGKLLAEQIRRLSDLLGRKVTVLDVGGRPDYWANVETGNVGSIRLLNNDGAELDRDGVNDGIFSAEIGDACNLAEFADASVDLVHANSVIEHVGLWPSIEAMAREVRRVGLSGWIQTPAFEFPIEPHYRLPFLHWTAAPVRRKLLWASTHYRNDGVSMRRHHIDRINLLSRVEMQTLFPDCKIEVERLVLPKSYIARWGPDGTAA